MANTQNSTNSREDELFSQYRQAYYEDGDLDLALTKLEEILKITNIKQYVSYLIIDVYSQMNNKAKEAYEVAAKGVEYPVPFSGLYKQYAELILVVDGDSDENLRVALYYIGRAIELYNQEIIREKVDESVVYDAESLKYWFDNKTKTRIDMVSLQNDIKSLMYSRTLYDGMSQAQAKTEKDIEQVKNDIVQEKQRTIELMALFTAIIALILSNVQGLGERKISDIIAMNVSLVAVLSWILYLVGLIRSGKRLIPKPNPNSIGKFLGLLIVFLLAISFIGLIAVGILYIYKWAISIV